MMRRFLRLLLLCGCTLISACEKEDAGKAEQAVPSGTPDGETVEIARDGKVLLPIVIAEESPQEMLDLAHEMAGLLGRITGGEVEVRQGSEEDGIFLGTEAEFPGILPAPAAGISPLLTRDDYALKTEGNKLFIVGRTFNGTRNAVWDFFHRIGFRQFFPGEHWEIVPDEPNLSVALNAYESPSYYTRRIFLAGRTSPEVKRLFGKWEIRNRMASGFTLNTNHAYDAIMGRNKAHFEAHPEDIAPFTNEHSKKFDPTQQTLLDVVARDAIAQFERNESLDSVSMDPSDGGDWRKDSPLGSPSNQAVTLANHVARNIQNAFPGKKVGMYAYHQHSEPPDIEVDPNVIISIATSFIPDGKTIEELAKGWKKKGAEIGIREYLSVWTWSQDLPGRARATQVNYIKDSIPEFYKLGARYWTSEASGGWGSQGLGYYLSSRILWNIEEDVDAMVEDFYSRAFGKSAPAMKEYFRCILAEYNPLVSEDLIGRMYRALDKALAENPSEAVKKRIFDFAAYTRFVELMFAYQNADGAERQKAYEALASFIHGTRDLLMVNTEGVLSSLLKRDNKIQEVTNFESANVDYPALIWNGIAANPLMEFAAMSFSEELIPAARFENAAGASPLTLRDENRLFLFADEKGVEFHFNIRGGKMYGTRGPVKLRLFAKLHPVLNESVATAEIPADKSLHEVTLASPYQGLHWMVISDGNDATEISWPKGQKAVLPMSPSERTQIFGSYDAVFYVPAGTELLGGYAGSTVGHIETAEGGIVFDFASMQKPGYFSTPVSFVKDGTWLRLRNVQGSVLLLTVPAYIARTPDEILIPQETK